MKTSYDIIIRPIITEQSMEALDLKKYVFEVARDATKADVKHAVEEIFSVKVDSVNTLNVRGKAKRTGRYPEGMSRAWKKAVVRLTKDSKAIEFFEGMV